jgi:hypothetical protein
VLTSFVRPVAFGINIRYNGLLFIVRHSALAGYRPQHPHCRHPELAPSPGCGPQRRWILSIEAAQREQAEVYSGVNPRAAAAAHSSSTQTAASAVVRLGSCGCPRQTSPCTVVAAITSAVAHAASTRRRPSPSASQCTFLTATGSNQVGGGTTLDDASSSSCASPAQQPSEPYTHSSDERVPLPKSCKHPKVTPGALTAAADGFKLLACTFCRAH